MTIEITHNTEATGTEAGNGEIGKIAWNEIHKIVMGTMRLIGRVTSGNGTAEEIAIYNGLLLDANGLGIDKATAANIRSRTSNKVLTGDNIASAKAAVSLAYSSTRSLVWTDGWLRPCTLTGNMTISNPTSVEAGDMIVLDLIGNSATERSVSWGTNYKGDLPDVTVTSTRRVVVFLYALTTSLIVVSHVVVE